MVVRFFCFVLFSCSYVLLASLVMVGVAAVTVAVVVVVLVVKCFIHQTVM